MKLNHALLFAVSGAAAGIAFVLSCWNHTSQSDAATCDCPASEPPIAGRIKRISTTKAVAGLATELGVAPCPDGSLLVSGSCMNGDIGLPDIVLQQSGVLTDDHGWECVFKNNTNNTVTIKVTEFCLSPTP